MPRHEYQNIAVKRANVDKIRKIAKDEERSLNWVINKAIDLYLEERALMMKAKAA